MLVFFVPFIMHVRAHLLFACRGIVSFKIQYPDCCGRNTLFASYIATYKTKVKIRRIDIINILYTTETSTCISYFFNKDIFGRILFYASMELLISYMLIFEIFIMFEYRITLTFS